VYFRDTSTGYVVGDSGIILKTTNGGTNWTRMPTPTTLPLYWIRFADANTGWAVGGGGVALRTTDGGVTWTLRDSGTNQGLTSVAFAGAARGWIVGVNGTILRNDNLVTPATTMTVSPVSPNGSNLWYKGVAPTITATTSVTSTTYYGWTSAAGPFDTYSAPFPAIEGTQTLYFYSADAGGNAETVKTLALKTDVTSPTVPVVGVVPSSITTSSAETTWTASTDAISGVAYYEVFVNGAYYGSSTTTSALLAGLSPFTPYFVTVRTVDVAGNVSDSSAAEGFTTKAVDTAPYVTVLTVNPFAANGADGWYVTTPTVTMSAVPAEDPITHYSWISDTGPWTHYGGPISPPPGLSTLYYWTEGQSGHVDELVRLLTFQVDTETPAAPSVTAAATSYQSIEASWTAVAATPSGIARYDVYLDGVVYASVTSPFVDIVGLNKSTSYAITVRAANSAGTTSTVSATVTATTPNSPRPSVPGAVYAKAPTGDSVYVDWTNATDTVGAVAYRVWRSDDGTTYSAVATTTGGLLGCSYIDTGLRSSTRYWYAISTVDSRGESASMSSTSTPAYTAPVTYRPPRPLGVTATPILGGVFVQWAASTNPAILGYYVSRGPCSLAASSTVTTLTPIPTTALGYIDWAVNDGEPYYYTVTAIDASGTLSSPSIEVMARSIIDVPGANAQPHEFGGPQSGCICHSSHNAIGVDTLIRFPGAGKQTMCPTCHAPSTSYQEFLDPLIKSRHAEGATVTVDEPFSCISCHVPLHKYGTEPANLMRVNSSSPCVEVTDTPAGNGFCYKCHGPGSTLPMGDLTYFESAGHRNIPAPPTGANITCDTCHESHASRNTGLLRFEGYMLCMQCHTASASNPDEVDIYTRLTLNEASNSKHPLLPQDQVTGARMTCQNCHNTHATTKLLPLVDPHNPSPAGTWANPRSDEKTFCFSCHDGEALPTSVETTPWASAVLARNAATSTLDLKTLYQTNVHGYGARSDGTTTTAFLRPDMGYKYGDVLECRACHDPHGTANGDAIQTDIVSASGDRTIRGVLTARLGGGVKDFRFFCNTCHMWDSASHDARVLAVRSVVVDTTVFPTNCSACHSHALGNTVDGGF
jgi:predicted CXXCH cytochrome family protein